MPSEEDKCTNFEEGLNREIHLGLGNTRHPTLTSFKKETHKVERLLKMPVVGNVLYNAKFVVF